MKTLARIATALISASIVVVPPLSAMADQKPTDAKPLEESANKSSSRHDRAIFPMKSDEFRKIVEKRIERMKTHIERSMTKHNLPVPARAEVNRTVDTAVKDIHAMVDKVAADGMVTKDEAKQLKDLAEQFRDKLREQFNDKSPKAKAPKAKAKHKGKDA
jgi:hypothetical protein